MNKGKLGYVHISHRTLPIFARFGSVDLDSDEFLLMVLFESSAQNVNLLHCDNNNMRMHINLKMRKT